ncbi:hypothetical protein AVEN_129169-1 [Araneus ventricosus]|uniref:Transposase Tc1-like domain-containing protein n=1 Tax=Araneus ventricosus TaxID=182803 RepID=A0A4Y2NLA6_ARAVE|nr:hypothetical protein AVEN_129169-1 [Araneus ventricosus]
MSVQLSIAVGTYRKMLSFIIREKADIHFIMGTANGNGSESQWFPNRRLPDRKTSERLHRQLCETGSILASRSDAGCPKTDGALVVEEAILDMGADHPSTSTRAVARQLHASHSTTWRVMKDESLHPYHVQRVQEPTQRDYPRRVEFVSWFLQQSAVNSDFGATVLFTDERTFIREGAFNAHNQLATYGSILVPRLGRRRRTFSAH